MKANQILVMLLKQYLRHLIWAIEEIEYQLPDEFSEQRPGIINEYTVYPILDSLYALRRVIMEDIETLQGMD